MEPSLSGANGNASGNEPSISGEHRQARIDGLVAAYTAWIEDANRRRAEHSMYEEERHQRELVEIARGHEYRIWDARNETVRALLDAGLTREEIAEAMGLDLNSIRHLAIPYSRT